MEQNLRIVLTGGPWTGKTTLLQLLADKGFAVVEEYSRQVIREEVSKNSNVLPWADLPAFSKRVIAGRVEQWHQGEKSLTPHFYDRSIVDSLAYLVKDGLPVPQEWDILAKEFRYFQKVFITPPWPEIYLQDAERKERLEMVTAIHEALVKTYKKYNYSVIEVPRMPALDRIEFILKEVGKGS